MLYRHKVQLALLPHLKNPFGLVRRPGLLMILGTFARKMRFLRFSECEALCFTKIVRRNFSLGLARKFELKFDL